ncbi:MAG: D-aminoacyl-tRNA deacylase [Chlamydiae bacterium]|nr:D-aminoacyl-tRNA deacylase [Chlamydiota bacterium]
MKIVIQRVQRASVTVEGDVVGAIDFGALVLLGIGKNDQAMQIPRMVEKLINLRFFHDDEGKMNRSLLDVGGELLIVSQFTLYANCKSGRRPSFTDSAPPDLAKELYLRFVEEARGKVAKVQTGSFGAYMQVSLVNDGPVTLLLEEGR